MIEPSWDPATESLVHIGAFPIVVPHGHIYLNEDLPSTYDYVPWRIIGETLREAAVPNLCLVDIGANVGDSLAHFRAYFDAPAICVEPFDTFFEILKRNAAQFGDVTLLHGLAAPPALKGRIALKNEPHTQTNSSRLAGPSDAAYEGAYVSFEDIFIDKNLNYVVKTDTDGFDVTIVEMILEHLDGFSAPIIFFEGPTQEQLGAGAIEGWLALLARLQATEYDLLILSNLGRPYVFAGDNVDAARSALVSLSCLMTRGLAYCHYFDFIAVRRDLAQQSFKLSSLEAVSRILEVAEAERAPKSEGPSPMSPSAEVWEG